MGIEGYSMGNMGLNTDLNAIQMVTQVEQIAQKGAEIIVKDIDKSEKGANIKRKKKDSKNHQEFMDSEEEDGNDENESNGEDFDNANRVTITSGLTLEDVENCNPKDFLVRLNSKTQAVELLDKSNGKVIEAMPAGEFMESMSKLDSSSGILVNRKV